MAPTVAASLVLLALPLDTACSCGPTPRPTMNVCDTPGTDFTGVTSLAIVEPLSVFGPQGGAHFQFELEALGTDVPTCIAYTGELRELVTGFRDRFSGMIRADAIEGGVHSNTIYVFDAPGGGSLTFVVTITALGRTTELRTGPLADAGVMDAGRDAPWIEEDVGTIEEDTGEDAPVDDAPVDDAPVDDAPSEDAPDTGA